MKEKNQIFYSLQTQYSNLGDELINKILLEKLQHYGNLIVDDRNVPEWYIKKLGLTSKQRGSYYGMKLNYLIVLSCLKRLFSPEVERVYSVTSPGHKYGSKTFREALPLLRSLLTTYPLFYMLGLQRCSFGISLGPFSKVLETLERWKARFMYFNSVRDSISEKYAHSIGIQNVRRFPDLAWLIQVPPSAQNSQDIFINGEYILFSFRSGTNAFTDAIQYREKLCLILDQIVDLYCIKLGKKLVISYQVEMDKEFNQYLENRYNKEKMIDVTLLAEKIEEETMYSIYNKAEMVFSNRLHVLLFSILCESLPVAVIDFEKHDKIRGIFVDANLEELIIDIEKTNYEISNLEKLIANLTVVKEKVNLYYRETREIGEALLEEVFNRD